MPTPASYFFGTDAPELSAGSLSARNGTLRRALPFSASSAFAAIALSVGVAASLVALPATAEAKAVNPYGIVAAQYESGSDPACVVSGSAYGAYQMSTGNAHAFATWLKATYQKKTKPYQFGTKLLVAYKKDGNACGKKFDAAWRSLGSAASTANTFHRYQYLYVKKILYTPTTKYLAANVKNFKLSKYSKALKNAIFSTSVQHGSWGAYKIVAKAFANLNGSKKRPAEKKLITEIYQVRAAYKSAKTIKKSVAGTGQKVYAISSKHTKYYVSNRMLTAKQAKKLVGKALVNFYSCSGATQVGVYYRLVVQEKNTALSLLS